jgi:hypothetical protein
MSVRLGDLPGWFAAIGTVGAFGISLWLLAQQMRDRRVQSAERRAAQARLVAAWEEDLDLEAKPFPQVVLMVRNGSDLPVYNVSIQAALGTRGTFVRGLGSMGPGETRELRIALPSPPSADVITPAVTFADAGQQRWFREGGTGILRELAEDEVVVFTEDPGAYGTYEEHPTLGLSQTPEERRGRTVT